MIRYPGSKAKIAKDIIGQMPDGVYRTMFNYDGSRSRYREIEYREPFFGAGAIGLHVLPQLPEGTAVWLNDKDWWLHCMWKSIQDYPRALIKMIVEFIPSPDAFYRFKQEDGAKDIHPVVAGFQKIALHQTSFSGLGARAGGPLGGRKQTSEYNVQCRWKPELLEKAVWNWHHLFRRLSVRITCRDFEVILQEAPESCVIYLDPPYYVQGGALYKHAMTHDDHVRLATRLRACRARWTLSYDDCPTIRALYQWAHIRTVDVAYTVGGHRKNNELTITKGVEA